MDWGTNLPEKVSTAIYSLDYKPWGLTHGFSTPVMRASPRTEAPPPTAAVHAKVVGNYVNGYLARTEVRRKGFDEALMLDTNGYVAEAPTSNIFLVRQGCVETPTKENVLPGITRKVVIDVLKDWGTGQETHLLPQDCVNTMRPFSQGPCAMYGHQPHRSLQTHLPRDQTKALMSRMHEVYSGAVEQYESLLTYVGES